MPRGGYYPGGGRKSGIEEKVRSFVINKSWDRAAEIMNRPKADKRKDIIMYEIIRKTIPQTIKAEIEGKLKLIFDK